ncbi:MAG: redoxin domain-containing protein [Phycisphaerae bacterium]|nr:redoxin domain-containing protein [Phycisphaerae bacterium]
MTQPKIDAKTKQVIERLAKHLGKAKTLTVDIRLSIEPVEGADEGPKVPTFKNTYRLAVARPNKLAFRGVEGKDNGILVADGKTLYSYIAATNEILKDDVPVGAADLLTGESKARSMRLRSGFFGGPSLVPRLLADQSYAEIVKEIETGSNVGTVEFDKTKCDLLKFTQKRMTWDMLIASGDKPVIMKIESRWTMPSRSEGKSGGGFVVTAVYEKWGVNTPLPEDMFKFTPPAGAVEAGATPPKRGGSPVGSHPTVGKPAPDFELNLLDGGKLKLSDQKGKNVVILDFWATWCGPCRKALPVIAGVAEAYKTKGVVFCAVNIQETPEAIKAFMKKQDLACSVGLDTDAAVAKRYGVSGIPHSVIIGKDGNVQAVHIGLAPGLKGQLTKELDTLLAGKDLSGGEDH